MALEIASAATENKLPEESISESIEIEVRIINPEDLLDTPALIKINGYPQETHVVETTDGYYLSMHRIPHGINEKKDSTVPKTAVLLQHGLLESSSDWVIMGPEKGLAFLLADSGYDVWMGNIRGNKYSKSHKKLSPTDKSFWDFSWHEMGYYDIPAQVDYIISQTGQEKIFYVGHSMGTTMFYVMNSMRPEYNSKFRAMFSLAPVAFMGRVRSPIRLIAPFVHQIEWISRMIRMNEFMPSNNFMHMLSAGVCGNDDVSKLLCGNILFLLCGYDSEELDKDKIPIIVAHSPAGTSTKTILHYGQEIKSLKFCQYDHGRLSNLKHYGTSSPPDYNLRRVTAPIYLFYSKNDWLAHPKDVEKLSQELSNVLGKLLIPLDSFNHLDFLWAINVKTLVYDKVMALMKEH